MADNKKAEEEVKPVVDKPSTSSKPATSSKAPKAEPIHTEAELYRFVDLGLGRGLDGTNATPWLNKTSFQVRQVTYESIVGTEEGGALQSYEREVSSVQTHQARIKNSLVVPQSPLTIGTDAELSRSVSTLRRTVGKRIINRTISFRDDFEDIPSPGQRETLTFEERLSHWILSQILEKEDGTVAGEVDPKLKLADVLQHGEREDAASVVEACYDFVQFFRITHYVSAIELGAAEYKTYTEDEYQEALSLAGTLGIDKIASFVSSSEATRKRKSTAADVKSIGRIGDNQSVIRGSHDEAVVSIKIQPITNLVRTQYLRQALKKALVQFVEIQSDRSDGPYVISCNNDKLFLAVQPDGSVVACDDIKEASEFYILPTDNKSQPYEFYIAHYDNTAVTARSSATADPLVIAEPSLGPIARYLEAPLNLRGTNRGPLSIHHHVIQSNSRFVIHSRLTSLRANAIPLALTSWTTGREIFFINCLGRKRRKDGYLCIRQSQGSKYITSCVSGTSAHNGYSIFMLFRLLPGSYRTKGFPGASREVTQSTKVLQVDTPRNGGADVHDKEEERHRDTVRLLKAPPSAHGTTEVPMLEIADTRI